MAVERFSSRREALGPVLSDRLTGAARYLRIAGYFRSSLLEVVGEALETVGEIRVVCNGDLDPWDVRVAKAARDGSAALAQTLVSAWQAGEEGLEVMLAKDRYRRLYQLLSSGKMKVRVVPRDQDNVFVHGKAGVIEHSDGRIYSFVGSANDSASGFRHSYEILWGDDDPDAGSWVRDEFEHFWRQGVDLPEAVVRHVAAMAIRSEYRSIEEARDKDGLVPPAAILADRPIYKGGQILRPWQKRFVQTCVDDRRMHGKARYLIADDVGLGKTLSMAAAALVLSILDDKPVLILAPATLIWQWQEELEDKLGLPTAVWSTQKKCWLDGDRRPLTQRGDASLVARCPWRIGIVSTGLIVNGSDEGERGALARKSFGVVILDEAHKARASRGQNGREPPKPNNLLNFLRTVAGNSSNVILGTATPIQLDAVELWDILMALNQGAPQVLGSYLEGSDWLREECIGQLTGQRPWPTHDHARWGLFRNPLPPRDEHSLFREIRDDGAIKDHEVSGPVFSRLGTDLKRAFLDEFETMAEQHNPVVRRVVRRTRSMLESKGLLRPISVSLHPRKEDGLPAQLFDGQGLVMNLAFQSAYADAEEFSRLYASRCPGAGFLKTIVLRRIGSSAKAGLETAQHLLGRLEGPVLPEDEVSEEGEPVNEARPAAAELEFLRSVERNLESVVNGSTVDPKVQVILHYLRDHYWLRDHGAIIFSQYLTTAEWVLEALTKEFPNEPIGLYAGGSASFVQKGSDRRYSPRDQIKRRIQEGEIRLVCATDAACEGLNLQRLGAQINMDMPWNPSRLEQRKGRIQRIGQVRDRIHVLNLRYAGSVEDQVYSSLSERFGDIFSVLGQLPDGFEADWIDAVLRDRAELQNFSQRVEATRPPMELRYAKHVADDEGLDWESTERVLSSRDIDDWMRQGW